MSEKKYDGKRIAEDAFSSFIMPLFSKIEDIDEAQTFLFFIATQAMTVQAESLNTASFEKHYKNAVNIIAHNIKKERGEVQS